MHKERKENMKRNLIAALVLSASMLVSCGEQNSGPSDKDVVDQIAAKAAIAMWADSGEVIRYTKTNEVEGAHTPILATSFMTRIEGTAYTAKIEWGGIDGTDWVKYDSDEEHVVVIAQRQSVGGKTLEATFVPTITYGGASVQGSSYKFTCAPYDVDPKQMTMAELAAGFYTNKTVKTKDVVKVSGQITFASPDYSSVIVQEGASAVQLYKGSAFSTFYGIGKSITTVGKIKDYSGLEFDPVLDVSPTSDVAIDKFEVTAANITAFREEMKDNNKAHANQLCEGELTVQKVYKNSSGVATTLYLNVDGGEEMALYTKSGFAGDDGANQIYSLFESCAEGDKVKFRGCMALYNDLVEVNIYSPNDVEVTEKASAE